MKWYIAAVNFFFLAESPLDDKFAFVTMCSDD
jgi:hypothetical protein